MLCTPFILGFDENIMGFSTNALPTQKWGTHDGNGLSDEFSVYNKLCLETVFKTLHFYNCMPKPIPVDAIMRATIDLEVGMYIWDYLPALAPNNCDNPPNWAY